MHCLVVQTSDATARSEVAEPTPVAGEVVPLGPARSHLPHLALARPRTNVTSGSGCRSARLVTHGADPNSRVCRFGDCQRITMVLPPGVAMRCSRVVKPGFFQISMEPLATAA